MKHQALQTIKTIILALIIVAGIQAASAAWTSAPENPPQNNTEAPVNVGEVKQNKLGALWLNTGLTHAIGLNVFGNALFNDKIGVGVNSPTQKVDVAGTVKAVGLQVTGGSPSAGKVLAATDSSGTVSWVNSGSASWNHNDVKVYSVYSNDVKTITMARSDGVRHKFCALTYNRPISTDDDNTNTYTRAPYCKIIRELEEVAGSGTGSSEPLPPTIFGGTSPDAVPNWKLQSYYSSCEAMCF